MQSGSLKLLSGSCGLFFLLLTVAFVQTKSPTQNTTKTALRETRSSPLDLEISGDLAGLPSGTIRYVRREDLLTLPQVSYTVTDDANFKGTTQASGVSLGELAQHL